MTKKRKTILFFTVEPGIAHITRTLAIAEELRSRGFKIVFAINKDKSTFIHQSGIEIVSVPVFLTKDLLSSFEQIRSIDYLKRLVVKELDILHQIKPDAIVIDFRFSSVAASAITDQPTFFITGSGGLPISGYLPNPGMSDIIWSIFSYILNQLVWKKVKKPYIDLLVEIAQTYKNNLSFEKMM